MKKIAVILWVLGAVIVYFLGNYFAWKPEWVLLLAFSFPFAIILLSWKGVSNKTNNYDFMKAVLGGFYVRFILSFILLGILLYFYKSIRYPIVGVFFSSYILFTLLEIKNFIYTLRADSEKDKKS